MEPTSGGGETEGAGDRGLSTRRMEATNLLLTVAAAALAWAFKSRETALAVAAGGLLTGASFRIIALVMGRILTPKPAAWWPLGLFWLKYMLMIAVVGALILKYKLDIPGFLIGVTLIVPAIILEAVAKPAAREDRKP